jgi:pyruvate,water dikinase
MARWRVLAELLSTLTRFLRRIRSYQRNLPARLGAVTGRCEQATAAIERATAAELVLLWPSIIEPLLRDTSRMLAAGARLDGAGLVRIRPWLIRLVGEADANALLTGLHTNAGPLASLGPVLGLDQLARGEIDRDEFVRRWGHRCPDEFEVSQPRPAEDPDWIDREVAAIRRTGSDVRALLGRQDQARAAALGRFRVRHPRKVRTLHRRLAGAARAARAREAARSEVIRAFWVLRRFILRAASLTGAGDDLFFLSIPEILDVLGGDSRPRGRVPVRRNTHRRYAVLPPYPTLIRGTFDPFRWAADPHRRGDIFDETRNIAPPADTVTGFPGATGVVEGTVRVLTSVARGEDLQPGDVLVTTVTNVGWTPLFPRAAAVITDIGAPLSHAAIVARELGIPAVVGTGNATSRLHTGDRVRVDGEHGTVEVLGPGGS